MEEAENTHVDNCAQQTSQWGERRYEQSTDADVEKLLNSMRMCSLKKMVYIGWNIGARTFEVCDGRISTTMIRVAEFDVRDRNSKMSDGTRGI